MYTKAGEDTRIFDTAAALFSASIRNRLLFLDACIRATAEEIRLRCGRGAAVVTCDGTVTLDINVTRGDIEETLDRASDCSMHSVMESLRRGYVTARGGYRVGVCGSGVVKDGENGGLRSISSLCVRIPRPCRCADEQILAAARSMSLLVASPPCGGKTTLIRDIVRRLSDEGARVSLIDERGELAAMKDGTPQMDVGRNTDVLELCSKQEALPILLRSMNPEVIAMDEISGAGDAGAIEQARGCGVRLIAGVHCTAGDSLKSRGVPPGVFGGAVFIEKRAGTRVYRLEAL